MDASGDGGRLVVGAVIRKNGCFLLLERAADDFLPGLFEFPSGKVEPGETTDEALVREIREETSLALLHIEREVDTFEYLSKSGVKTIQRSFIVTMTLGVVVLSEHASFVWASMETCRSLKLSAETLRICERVAESTIS